MSYKTSTYQPDSSQAHTTVTFSLSQRDWCELEKTIEWVNFVKILEKYQNKKGNMGAKMLESISSGKATVNEAGNKRVLYFCDCRKNKECKKNSCYSKGTADCFFTSKSQYRATGILRLFLKIVTWKTRKALKNRIDYK